MNTENKYYWVSIVYFSKYDPIYDNEVIDIHPFLHVHQLNLIEKGGCELLNWSEINKEDFDQFNKLKEEFEEKVINAKA